MVETVWIGLGSNLADPVSQLRSGLDALSNLPRTRRVACSAMYRNPPMGPPDQPDYVNAVARLATTMAPLALLDALQAIETAQGRRRGRRWGARTLDLDVLLFGVRVIAHPRLVVPHPGLPERPFVLYPLAELAPRLRIPGHGPVSRLLARVDASGLERIDA